MITDTMITTPRDTPGRSLQLSQSHRNLAVDTTPAHGLRLDPPVHVIGQPGHALLHRRLTISADEYLVHRIEQLSTKARPRIDRDHLASGSAAEHAARIQVPMHQSDRAILGQRAGRNPGILNKPRRHVLTADT